MKPRGFTFKKVERLCRDNDIDRLFSEGRSVFLYPFKVFFLADAASHPIKLLLSVSKKRYKKAVDRNLIKRRCREAYRQQKHVLYTEEGKALQDLAFLGVIYVGKEILPFSEIEKKLSLILQQVLTHLNEDIQK